MTEVKRNFKDDSTVRRLENWKKRGSLKREIV